MAQSTPVSRTVVLLWALLAGVTGCPADSIQNGGATGPGVLLNDGSPSNYEGYFPDPGTEDTTTPDIPDFGRLGTELGFFLFSPNTMFGFDGMPTFSILSANTNLEDGFMALNDPTTKLMSFTVPGPGPGHNSQSNLPEPRSLYMAIAGVALLTISAVWRAKAR